MNRNLKTLGLALVAILALGALVASSASARVFSEKEHTIITSSADEGAKQVFEVEAGSGIKLECTTLTLDENTVTGTEIAANEFEAADITVKPTYSGCTGPLGSTVHVTNEGCNYTFTFTENNTTTGPAHVVCQTNKFIKITVTAPLFGDICTVKVGSQSPTGTVHYTNIGTGTTREITVNPTITGIHATREGSTACAEEAAPTTGTYSGKVIITGEEDGGAGGHVGIWVP